MADQANSGNPAKIESAVALIDSGFEWKKATATISADAEAAFDRRHGLATIRVETGAVWLQTYASPRECRELAQALLNAASVIDAIPAQAEAA